MAKDINFFGSWINVPYVDLPQIGGGSARFTDVTDTTASAADVSQNKYFYTASGVYTQGSSAGGGADSTFVITLSWNSTSEMWEPDCTYAQLFSAVSAGKRITIEVPSEDNVGTNYAWSTEEACLYYIVFQTDSAKWTENVYVFSSRGLEVNYVDTISQPSGTINITASGNTDVTQYATASVPNADYEPDGVTGEFLTINGIRKWRAQSGLTVESAGWITSGYKESYTTVYNAVTANTTITPSTSAQTIGGANYMMEGAVTVAAMPSGTAGTPTATKGTVSNHAVSITPSVTNTTGYITGSTITGVAISVSASELVSGSNTVTANGTVDVTNLASLIVNVASGGGGASNIVCGEFTTPSTTTASSLTIPYTGSGYPIIAYFCIKGGAYTSGTTWYNAVQRYAIGAWAMSKANMSSAPTYGTSGAENQGVTMSIYKNSTSSATSYTRTSAMTTNVFTSSNASNAAATAIRFKTNAKTVSYYTNTSSYGLYPNQTYQYCIVYSS